MGNSTIKTQHAYTSNSSQAVPVSATLGGILALKSFSYVATL